MQKVDCALNQYVAKALCENYDWIINATADCTENFNIDDVMFSAGTKDNYAGIPMEVKSIKGGWQLKYDGDWNPYFTTGIYNKLVFKSTTPPAGTPIYFVNATDAYGNYENGKWKKLLDAHACLCYLAPDGLLLFSPKSLKEAFIGYADYYVKHTTEFNQKGGKIWEKKAVISLEKSVYLPLNPPLYLFKK